jgi:uncharacterized protein (TIGR00255 family)
MIKSMTGFGKQVLDLDNSKITIEIRTLNSKQLDVNCRISNSYKTYELDIRNLIAEQLERGKVDCSITVEKNSAESASVINMELANHYLAQIRDLSKTANLGTDNELLSIILKMPDIFITPEHVINDEELKLLKSSVLKALHSVNEYRTNEGASLEKDIKSRINIILDLLNQVSEFEAERTNRIKERLKNNLLQNFESGQIDQNRFEQEIIFYIEKLDITEEKIRLKKNCDYFLETLKLPDSSGKKLGFIGQEIGREINTLGSKANDADLQRLVILMKDELEKIKEQLFNIL